MAATRENAVVNMDRLLPSVYRVNDAELGSALEALLDVIGREADSVKANIDQLWDDFFIETCADWVIPYIGDLVGNRALQEAVMRRRADVARTIHYRRRKGTLAMLEQMAAAVTGWSAHAVAAFELLSWTQNLNHLRIAPAPIRQRDVPDIVDAQVFDRVGTVNLRNVESLWRLNTAFDGMAHSIDVRQSPAPILSALPPDELADRGLDATQGWYGIRNVLFYLWRIASFKLTHATARKSGANAFHFSSIGNPAPLFAPMAPAHEDAVLVKEWEVAGPIRPAAFYYGPDDYYPRAFEIKTITAGVSTTVPPASIVCRNLSRWQEPPPGCVAVDVHLGRIRFRNGVEPDSVHVTYSYGTCAPIGGGPYERRGRTFDGVHDTVAEPQVAVAGWRLYTVGQGLAFPRIGDALTQWSTTDHKPDAVIEVQDSSTYVENLAIGTTTTTLIIQAMNGQRPTLIGNVAVTGAGDAGQVRLDGFVVAGQVSVTSQLGVLAVGHCTLVPGLGLDETGEPADLGQASIVIGHDNSKLALTLDHCISGPLRPASDMSRLTVADSIVDAGATRASPALVSGPINAIPTMGGPIEVTIGKDGPYVIGVNKPNPATLAQAAAAVQTAIRAIPGGAAFKAAVVFPIDGKRIAIVPGTPGTVRVTAAGTDTTASDYKLDAASSTPAAAMVGDHLDSVPDLTHSDRLLTAWVADQPFAVTVAKTSDTLLASIAASLQAGLLAAGGGLWPSVIVQSTGDRLMVLSPDDSPLPLLTADPGDPLAYLLGITTARQAIVALDLGSPFGPDSDLSRTTVVGESNVRELNASEVIFTDIVRSERTQAGCVRFSYVRPGSRTPRTFHCQPQDDMDATLTALVEPVFKSLRYGEPAYGQLDLVCAPEITTGAENGSEMGAYSSLEQPQRESGLLLRLQEYLPVGRQAGLIYVN